MREIFAQMLYELEKHNDVMLVTIVREGGSVPRGTGSQMLVGKHGRILGTIGGGAVEDHSEKEAVRLIGEKQSELHEFLLRANPGEDIGMVCGGDVTVHFGYISAEDESWRTAAGIVCNRIDERRGGTLVIPLEEGAPRLEEDGTEQCVLDGKWFRMPLPVGERALIFGGGHIAQALVPVLSSVGFRVTVMDSRVEYAYPERFPQAERVIAGDFEKISDYLEIRPDDYVVIMTNGHAYDLVVEEQILRRETAYVGVIGSRKKRDAVNAKLREHGIPEEVIGSVHAPIGTNIKAVTPPELAISIAGEMILERALHRESQIGKQDFGCPMH